MRCSSEGYEKLRAIGVSTCISKGKETLLSVLQFKVLIWESAPIDALSTCTIEISEITTLHHKVFDYSVENSALEMQKLSILRAFARFASAKLSEIFCSTGDYVLEKFHHDFALGLSSNIDFEEDAWVGW
jgi:hypothetical protein